MGVQRSALADALEAEDDERQEEAACGDGRPMLAPHGPALSVQLRRVRLRLREFLATQAAAGKSVPMQRTALGLHPTMRWTIRFGKWLATTRITAPRASRWHATERGDAREEEPTVRTGRGENTVYIGLQHMKNHVWREIWPAMPSDARQYLTQHATCNTPHCAIPPTHSGVSNHTSTSIAEMPQALAGEGRKNQSLEIGRCVVVEIVPNPRE
mmetsp:Transcript_6724/g.22446  ORF Transcript_6724/g.22446 Transcript_6724/m.22446 type:complete len:213 (-) Transcript_6724:1297-1935(-)